MGIMVGLPSPSGSEKDLQLNFGKNMTVQVEMRAPHLPAEWYTQSGIQLTWPHAGTDWAYMLAEVQECFINIAREIAKRELLLIVTPEPEEVKKQIAATVNMNNVRIAEFAMRTPMQIARIESNDLRKRMGDIRSSEGVTGVWARYDGGRFSGGEFENKFNKVQVGADTALAAYGSRLGLSFSYTQGDADMSGISGISADTDAYSLAAYGMWFGEAGQFADVIGRVGTVDTDLATRTYKTNYDQLMLSLSGEFGWRFDLTDAFYAEPSAELTYTRVDGETFKANGNTLGIDDYDSMVGRIGATAGLNCSQGRGGVYARFGVAHEFMGDGRFTAVNAAGTAADPIEVDGKDTWVEYGLGANFILTNSTYLWADVERTSGGYLDEDWRATVGVRYNF